MQLRAIDQWHLFAETLRAIPTVISNTSLTFLPFFSGNYNNPICAASSINSSRRSILQYVDSSYIIGIQHLEPLIDQQTVYDINRRGSILYRVISPNLNAGSLSGFCTILDKYTSNFPLQCSIQIGGRDLL